MSMSPLSLHLAEQASTEMDSAKLIHLIGELCRAIDSEHEKNRHSRMGCIEDCREYEKKPLEPNPCKPMTSPAVSPPDVCGQAA
jgi:hypothetical protein